IFFFCVLCARYSEFRLRRSRARIFAVNEKTLVEHQRAWCMPPRREQAKIAVTAVGKIIHPLATKTSIVIHWSTVSQPVSAAPCAGYAALDSAARCQSDPRSPSAHRTKDQLPHRQKASRCSEL